MYGRFHQQLLTVIGHGLNLSFIIDNRETSWFSYMYASSKRYSSEMLWFPIVYLYMWCVHHSPFMILLYCHHYSYYVISLTNCAVDRIQHSLIMWHLTAAECSLALTVATAPQHIKPYSLTSTSYSVVFSIFPGVVGPVAHVADGSTKSETTPAKHLPTSGYRPLDAVIMDERRDGPRCLRDDDVSGSARELIMYTEI